MKKTFNRQKSINPNLISIKDVNMVISQKSIKSKENASPQIPKIESKKNIKKIQKKESKIKKNTDNKDLVLITNESSYLVLESFLNEHQIKYTSIFILYLSEIWRELSLYSSDYNKGIIPFAFSRFFPLPGLISKRLFDVLDLNKDGFLSPKEFIQGLSIIFCEEIYSLIEFIFLFYDFDYDGFITSEDIHAVMSYIPVINSFHDMIDIEEEIQNTLEEIFVDEKNKINLSEFTDLIINKERYEIFIPIISFFFEQKPFSNQEINFFYGELLNDDNLNNNDDKEKFYKIEGKIKLKIIKDDNIGKDLDNKIAFNFDKNNYNKLSYQNDNLDKNDDSLDNKTFNNNKDNQNNNINIINHDNNNNTDSYAENNENNNNFKEEKNNNITDSYDEKTNNINIIENEKEEDNNDNINIIENENEEDESYIVNDIDNVNNNLHNLSKFSSFSKKESLNSFSLPKDNHKSYSRQHSVRDIKHIQKKVISHFGHHEEENEKNEIINKEDINKEEYDRMKYLKLKEERMKQYRNRTQSMRNIKYKKENLQELVSKSKGFKHLQNSIPSLINNTKILAKYSSRNIQIYEESILNQYKKGNVIKDLCKSKINLDNESSNYQTKRKITEDSYEIERNEANEFIGIKLVNNEKNNNKDDENPKTNRNNKSEFQNNDKVTYESYLYKITPNSKKLKKLYFKLYNKNLYYYKNDKSQIHKGMHNLCHYFLELTEDSENESEESSIVVEKNNNSYREEEEDESYIDSEKNSNDNDSEIIIKKINSIDYYCFILMSQKGKAQWYLTPDKKIYTDWVESLKLAMKYKDILEQYEFKEIVGKGKFSIVYCAYDKINKRKVAIKRIDKTILKLSELELIKTEIDILKICQHPYVIGLYDVIETFNTMDIILEYCQIGNLYNYLYKKNFQLTEQQIVTYIHKISKAVYSMHNLGIVHRDLKLSNIAMADGNEEDIRILDFGLSKIIGPGETCNESYGTPGYAAPEVINEEKYRFKADVWSIGAISYFMCSSKLPFDYPTKGLNKTNIILNTLNDELKFNADCWKKYSKEAIKFIKACMNKNSEKRLTIKQVLEHDWIKKFFYREVANRESCNNVAIYNSNAKLKKKVERQKSYQKKISSMATTYRLYADISDNKAIN